MYIPPHFAETRAEELQRIIRAHPLGTLVTHTRSGLDANHIPFEFDPTHGEHGLRLAAVSDGYASHGDLSWGGCLYLAELVSEQA